MKKLINPEILKKLKKTITLMICLQKLEISHKTLRF